MLGNRLEYMEASSHTQNSTYAPCMLTTAQIFLAGAELGAYVTLLNYGYTAQELVAALNVSQCNILIATLKTSRYNYQSALECLKQEVTSLEHIVILPDVGQRDVQLPPGSDFRPYQDVLAGRRAGNPSLARPAPPRIYSTYNLPRGAQVCPRRLL
ncbi:hypothetical protein BJX65DRAFT_291412 [Aspergillus insuetus]